MWIDTVCSLPLAISGDTIIVDPTTSVLQRIESTTISQSEYSPRFSGMTIGVTIPLKFSNMNKGSVNAAKFRQQQAEQQYAQARIEIESDVLSSLRNYRTTLAQLQSLDAETLIESEKIYNSYRDAYTHGEVSLVELLEVRQNYEDIQRLHVETLCATSTAYARLMAALGL